MANQNFRVKKGLEVGLGGTIITANDTGVGIGSSAPQAQLDVRGETRLENPGSTQTGPYSLEVVGKILKNYWRTAGILLEVIN